MDLVTTTMLIYVSINLLGLVWTAVTIHFGIPDEMRIQSRTQNWKTLRGRLPLVFLNQAILLTGVWIALGSFGHLFTMQVDNMMIIILQISIIMVFDDFWFYCWHRLMHEHKGLYNKIHRIHHRAYAPLPIEYIYVHPLEWMIGSLGPLVGLAIVLQTWGLIPAWTLWGYLLVRNLHELDVHSGIKSPLGRLIPLYASTEHHDLHHAKPTKGNYATTLELWDRLMGTHWRPGDLQSEQTKRHAQAWSAPQTKGH